MHIDKGMTIPFEEKMASHDCYYHHNHPLQPDHIALQFPAGQVLITCSSLRHSLTGVSHGSKIWHAYSK